MQKTKPFCIFKKAFVKAFEIVKANKGTNGIDGQTIEMFEEERGL